MRSKVAEEVRREQAARLLAMSADERLEAAFALGEQAVSDYMQNFGVDRDEAVRRLRNASQAGRRRSLCNEDSDGHDQRGR